MPGVTADQAGHVAGSFAKAPPLHRPDAGEGLFSLAGVPYGVAARGALRLRKQRNRVLDRLLERMEAL